MLRCTMDPACGFLYCTVPYEGKRTDIDVASERLSIPEPPQGMTASVEFDEGDPEGAQLKEMYSAFKRETLAALRELLPAGIYKTIARNCED